MRNTNTIFKAAILAGGKAKRLQGIAKGNLIITPGVTIMQNLITQIKKAAINNIIINANDMQPYKQYRLTIVPDNRKYLGSMGALSGIASVLEYYALQCDAILFLPCDAPNITAEVIVKLKAAFNAVFNNTENAIVYACTAIRAQPLCVIISVKQAAAIFLALKHGEFKIIELWKKLGALAVNFSEEQLFLNVNCVADVQGLLKCDSL